MTQTKKKSQKSEKKQPISVQLSKDDLKELLVVLKDFMQEEIQGISRVQNHRLDCHNQRIISLEGKERRRESNRISSCPHKYRIESIQYFEISHRLALVIYRCERCKIEWQKLPCFLTRKEEKALKKLGVEL